MSFYSEWYRLDARRKTEALKIEQRTKRALKSSRRQTEIALHRKSCSREKDEWWLTIVMFRLTNTKQKRQKKTSPIHITVNRNTCYPNEAGTTSLRRLHLCYIIVVVSIGYMHGKKTDIAQRASVSVWGACYAPSANGTVILCLSTSHSSRIQRIFQIRSVARRLFHPAARIRTST